MKSYVDADGRWHHRLRQSWLKTSTLCLERARLEHEKLMPKVEADASNVGTAVHAAIETCLSDPLSEEDTVECFHMVFGELMESPHWRWIKYTEKSARAFGERCVRVWHKQVLPTLPEERQLEVEFCVPFVDDDERVIELSGTIDYVDTQLRDWKTSGGMPWQKWEHERWDIQPTIYTFAANWLGLIKPAGAFEFEFVVLDGKGVQRISVTRRPSDWDWLKAKSIETAKLIELQLATWPTNDTHALCSPKWCPAWDQCKGKYVDARWPR